MKEVFTTGPWTVRRPSVSGEWYVDIDRPDWSAFARVVVRMRGTDEDVPGTDTLANTVAALPEIYDTLKGVESAIDGAGFWRDAIPKLRAVIAIMEGGAK